MEAIVLAGGLGTRLSKVVPDVPKPMALVNGRPFLEHLFDRLIDSGISRIVVSVGHRAEQITAHFGASYRGTPLVYAIEQEPLGTGGAIAFALRQCGAGRVFVLNGDTYLDMPFAAFRAACSSAGAQLGIVVREVTDTARYGACDVEDGVVVRFGEKLRAGPGWINAGVYCLTPDVFQPYALPSRFSFEQDFISKFLPQLAPVGFPVRGYFIDIGVPEDYHRAQRDFAAAAQRVDPGERA